MERFPRSTNCDQYGVVSVGCWLSATFLSKAVPGGEPIAVLTGRRDPSEDVVPTRARVLQNHLTARREPTVVSNMVVKSTADCTI